MVNIVVFRFFFFKQKTAYEMRISDWRSDVFSSDLTTENNPEELLRSGGLFDLTTNPEEDEDFDFSNVPAAEHILDAMVASVGNWTLDRKSVVRERVCQYV